MRITILVFAKLRDLVGTPQLVRDVAAGSTIEDVWQALAGEFPAAAALSDGTVRGRERRLREVLDTGRRGRPCGVSAAGIGRIDSKKRD